MKPKLFGEPQIAVKPILLRGSKLPETLGLSRVRGLWKPKLGDTEALSRGPKLGEHRGLWRPKVADTESTRNWFASEEVSVWG